MKPGANKFNRIKNIQGFTVIKFNRCLMKKPIPGVFQ